MVWKTCKTCEVIFRVSPSHSYRKYCSRACQVKDKEWCKNISEAKKHKERITKICPTCGKKFEVPSSNDRVIYCSRSCSNNDEWRIHVAEGNRGKSPSLETRKKMSVIHIKYHWTRDELYSLYWVKGKTLVEMGEKLGASGTTVLYWLKKHGITRRDNLVASNRKPNGLEVSLINIIKETGLPYKYVGNGTKLIGKKKPDFINTNGEKKVIELFGRYWHDPEVNSYLRSSVTMEKKINHYHIYGYKCLVIWDEELREVDNLVKKIRDF